MLHHLEWGGRTSGLSCWVSQIETDFFGEDQCVTVGGVLWTQRLALLFKDVVGFRAPICWLVWETSCAAFARNLRHSALRGDLGWSQCVVGFQRHASLRLMDCLSYWHCQIHSRLILLRLFVLCRFATLGIFLCFLWLLFIVLVFESTSRGCTKTASSDSFFLWLILRWMLTCCVWMHMHAFKTDKRLSWRLL